MLAIALTATLLVLEIPRLSGFDSTRTPGTVQSSAVDEMLNAGLQQYNAGHFDQAIAVWQRILQIDPRNALAANDIGSAYMGKHDPGTATVWFQKALAIDPTMQLARNNLAWAASEQQH